MDQELQPAGTEHIEIEELSSFFDLLARFDFEDQKKAQSVQQNCNQGTADQLNPPKSQGSVQVFL